MAKTYNKETIQLRPHHLLCFLSFKGLGYSNEFVANYWQVVDKIKNHDALIQIVFKNDYICASCPHYINQNLCQYQTKIKSLDKRHTEVLALGAGQVLSYAQVKELIKTKMSLEKFHKACNGCSWKSLGICESTLMKLLK